MSASKALRCAARDYKRLREAAAASPSSSSPSAAGLVSVSLSSPKAGAEREEEEDLFSWRVVIRPPLGSVYGGPHPTHPSVDVVYTFEWTLSAQRYPHQPPDIVVATPIFHPLIDESDGKLCEGVLADVWKPTTSPMDVVGVLTHVIFEEYNQGEAPSNAGAARLLEDGKDAFTAEVVKRKSQIR